MQLFFLHHVFLFTNLPLSSVMSHEADNKMSQTNLVSLFGPTLMTVDGDAVRITNLKILLLMHMQLESNIIDLK